MSEVAPRVNISKSTHDRHKRELTRLRAENAKLSARAVLIPDSVQRIIDDYPAVCAERDRMRAAAKPLIEIENYPDRVLMPH